MISMIKATCFFGYLGCFGMGAVACPIDTSPSATLWCLCWAGMRSLKRGWRKSKKLNMKFRFGGVNSEKTLRETLTYKMNCRRNTLWSILLLIFEMPCTGYNRGHKGNYRFMKVNEIYYVDVIRLYSYICKYGKFSVGHPTEYVGADCPIDYLPKEGIIKYKFLSARKLQIQSFRIKANLNWCSVCVMLEPTR